MNGERLDVFRFQYFDPNKNLFETLPPPPLPTHRVDIGLLSVRCHFFFRGYIYLFITDTYTCFQTSKFNTRESKWEDCKSMVDRFEKKNIPFPFFDVGNIGISDEFVDNAWILVGLNGALPTAYHVCLTDEGDIDPISHRVLAELYTSGVDMHCSATDWKQLADMGGGRFCVMCCNLDEEEFLLYGFKIDFKVEHTIQSNNTEGCSSHVIFKMKFNRNDPIPLKHLLTGFCIASAPPLASPSSAPPLLAYPDNEDQDKNDRKSKRKRESRLFV
ncbi:uncharacterized protein LOC115996740 [Ipomoea triloba]|uniref:uncharacterized protein LOC115996740 n=1 Tax=Ipomoea triloba TaxID=35885 RepID=UPI00125DBA3E|nr:uncharacterized protein LOC115996740 [Ipomoea triloba]XP_031091979.1 uncharacterized protein LOC115996740 [Ipomoea triloba]XP_031091980.1 uncharacterized protein LOC115996740 [Ipomoea triloba]